MPTMKCPPYREKDEFLIPFIEAIMDPNFKTGTPEPTKPCSKKA